MTHEELSKQLEGLWHDSYKAPGYIALCAVVELHKPEEFENGPDNYKLVCSHCQLGVIGEVYPCETIHAIEKELM